MDPRIAWAIEQMQQRLGSPIRIDELAAALNLSVSRFAHLFRQQTGMPPKRHLHSLRMHRARVLVERTFLSIKEVMVQVGINDPSHFSRQFRRHHGVGPAQLRRRCGLAAASANTQPEAPTDDRPPSTPVLLP
jgi:AraC family transcriptional regulator of arabinose operon